MSSVSAPQVSAASSAELRPAFFRLMWFVHCGMLGARISALRRESRLMLFVLGSFIAGYLVVGFLLFYGGLNYLDQFPMVGPLLSRRVLFLTFAFFFAMLFFSNLVVTHGTLFRSVETGWLLTLPVDARDVFRWKLVESFFVSSWALLFFTAPLIAAYAVVMKGGGLFLVASWVGLIPFVVLPGVLAAFASLALARFMNPVLLRAFLWLGGGALLFALVVVIRPGNPDAAVITTELVSVGSLLRQSEVVLNEALPSVWLSRSLLAVVERLPWEAIFYGMLLLCYALVAISLASRLGSRFFYRCWQSAVHLDLHRKMRRPQVRSVANGKASPLPERKVGWNPPGPAFALVWKDQILFWRDPSQWSQFLIFFGLLGIYVLNLRNVTVDVGSAFWSMMISYLNLASSALTLSTLTTRFVFPQFSLEGRRLWILGMSPFGLGRVVCVKFWASAIGTGGITTALMLLSSAMLQLPTGNTAVFCGAVALLAIGLSGLAVGLGTLFPNLREESPARIVSGFGGTLCLVLSFVFILLMLAFLALPAVFQNRDVGEPLFRLDASTAIGCFGALVCALAAAGIPMVLAIKKARDFEI